MPLLMVAVLAGFRQLRQRRGRSSSLSIQAKKLSVIEDTRDNHSGPACGEKLKVTVKNMADVGFYCSAPGGIHVWMEMRDLKLPVERYYTGMKVDVTVYRPALPSQREISHAKATDRELIPLSKFHVGDCVDGTVISMSDQGVLLDVGTAKLARCLRKHLPRQDKTLSPEAIVAGLRITHIFRTRFQVVAKEIQLRQLRDFKVGERLEGIVRRTLPSRGMVFFDVDAEDSVAASVRHGGLVKGVDGYQPHAQTMLEVVKVQNNRVYVKDLGSEV